MGSRTQAYAMILIALSLVGCASTPVPPANEYRIALQELDESWLAKCQGLGDLPDRAVGTLLQDYIELTKVAAPCRVNHNALIEYLAPLIKQANEESSNADVHQGGGG